MVVGNIGDIMRINLTQQQNMESTAYMLLVLMTYYSLCETYKILLISPIPSKSHHILSIGLVKHLTNAGHEITLVTAFPNEFHSPLVREIDLSGIRALVPVEEILSLKSILDKKSLVTDTGLFLRLARGMATMALQNPDMQKIMNDPKEKFDLIIGEWMYSDLYSGLPAIFQCPFVWLSTVEPHWMIYHLIDEFPNPTYTPDSMSNNVPPMTFIERVDELGLLIKGVVHRFLYQTSGELEDYENIIVPIARKRGNIIPNFEELRYNISLVLGNSHVSMGQPLRLPQSYKPIGGYHINKDVKPLPQDLQSLMDKGKDGVIYFSMGSNLKSSMLPDVMKRDLLKMFGRLKNTVIWKFEEDLPDRPTNVHIVKWAPQPSILSHPNCALFITHGGLLSTTEAIHFAVPIIGIPVFGDQFNNVDRAVKKGFAKFVPFSYNMANDLEEAIGGIMNDPSYTARVKELSFIYHHRPTTPAAEMVHWVEHVILTQGASHLRSPALSVPWYQKLYLDLFGLVLFTLIIIYSMIRRLLRKLLSNQKSAKKKLN